MSRSPREVWIVRRGPNLMTTALHSERAARRYVESRDDLRDAHPPFEVHGPYRLAGGMGRSACRPSGLDELRTPQN